MKYQTPTELRIQKARTALLLDHPFFGSLLFRLKGRACRSIATMATDGVSLYYNPEFVDTLNPAGCWPMTCSAAIICDSHKHLQNARVRDGGQGFSLSQYDAAASSTFR
jgi:hypothetical protein